MFYPLGEYAARAYGVDFFIPAGVNTGDNYDVGSKAVTSGYTRDDAPARATTSAMIRLQQRRGWECQAGEEQIAVGQPIATRPVIKPESLSVICLICLSAKKGSMDHPWWDTYTAVVLYLLNRCAKGDSAQLWLPGLPW